MPFDTTPESRNTSIPHPDVKNYKMLFAPPPKGPVGFFSDTHLGRLESRGHETYRVMRDGLRKGELAEVIHGGDAGDREHPEAIGQALDEMESLLKRGRVTKLLGNHDNTAEYQEGLRSLENIYPDRFRFGSGLTMGDAFFTHGDLDDHRPQTPTDIRAYAAQKALARGQRTEANDPERKIVRHAQMVAENFPKESRWSNHIFMGHFHPHDPMVNRMLGDRASLQQFHISGCSLQRHPNMAFAIQFNPDGKVESVSPYFYQPRSMVMTEMDRRMIAEQRRHIPSPSF